MLHKSTDIILPETFRLLQTLMKDPELNSFFLVRGTALALPLGHRLSVDLDLFTREDFDARELNSYLADNYPFVSTSIKRILCWVLLMG